jgi:hypothetical protein
VAVPILRSSCTARPSCYGRCLELADAPRSASEADCEWSAVRATVELGLTAQATLSCQH